MIGDDSDRCWESKIKLNHKASTCLLTFSHELTLFVLIIFLSILPYLLTTSNVIREHNGGIFHLMNTVDLTKMKASLSLCEENEKQ